MPPKMLGGIETGAATATVVARYGQFGVGVRAASGPSSHRVLPQLPVLPALRHRARHVARQQGAVVRRADQHLLRRRRQRRRRLGKILPVSSTFALWSCDPIQGRI